MSLRLVASAIAGLDGLALPWLSKALVNHSHDGFAWGYWGSGSAQLALALLLDSIGEQVALAHYYQFKEEVVGQLPSEFYLTRREIVEWVKAQRVGYKEPCPSISSQYAEVGKLE